MSPDRPGGSRFDHLATSTRSRCLYQDGARVAAFNGPPLAALLVAARDGEAVPPSEVAPGMGAPALEALES